MNFGFFKFPLSSYLMVLPVTWKSELGNSLTSYRIKILPFLGTKCMVKCKDSGPGRPGFNPTSASCEVITSRSYVSRPQSHYLKKGITVAHLIGSL